MIFRAPALLTAQFIYHFLNEVERIFEMENTRTPNVELDLTKVKQTDVLGLLLIYKYIDYTYRNRCFKGFQITPNTFITVKLKKFGMYKVIEAYKNEQLPENPYQCLEVKINDNFIIAPQPLLRNFDYSTDHIRKNYLPKIEEYYSNNEEISSMIFACLSEILLNFWEHAVLDSNTILASEGDKVHFEIGCVDNGAGIVSTLSSSSDLVYRLQELTKEDVLELALSKGITSKSETHHMGYGLWMVNQIVSLTKGELYLYSEGVYYINERGKKRKGKCALWKGTIIYVCLPLSNPIALSGIFAKNELEDLNRIPINFK